MREMARDTPGGAVRPSTCARRNSSQAAAGMLGRLATVLLVLALPAAAWAQAGWYAIPSLTLMGEFDSNINGTAHGQESDEIFRVIPGITLGYRSDPLTVLASYSFSAELYANNDDLNNVGDNQRGGLTVAYHPNPRLDFNLGVTYVRSPDTSDFVLVPLATPLPGAPAAAGQPTPALPQVPSGSSAPPPPTPVATAGPAPGTVAPVPGIDVGRQTTHALGVSAGATYRFDPRTSGTLAYGLTGIDLEGSGTDLEHTLSLSADRTFTPVDSGTLRFTARYFNSDDAGTASSYALVAGWSRQLSETTSFSLGAGPSVTDDGDVNAEAYANLSHQLSSWATIGASYSHQQGLVVGRPGASINDVVSAGLAFTPFKATSVGLAASWTRSEGLQSDAVPVTYGYGFSASIAHQVRRWLGVSLTYTFSASQDGDTVPDHVVQLAITFSDVFRLY